MCCNIGGGKYLEHGLQFRISGYLLVFIQVRENLTCNGGNSGTRQYLFYSIYLLYFLYSKTYIPLIILHLKGECQVEQEEGGEIKREENHSFGFPFRGLQRTLHGWLLFFHLICSHEHIFRLTSSSFRMRLEVLSF
jgi:hypothetical protein